MTSALGSLCLLALTSGAAQAGAATQSAADWSSQLAGALSNGEFDLGFRWRYEFVDQSGFDKDANASTLRTRVVYKSGEFRDTFLTLGMDDLRPIIGHDFNDTRNGKSNYPVVADPKGTDLNLASLTWTGLENGTIVLGRQRIQRGNLRFVGNVGWRQNEQTYDSLSGTYRFNDRFDVFYAYVDRVKRIFGPDEGSPTEAFRSNSHLLDAGFVLTPEIKLFGYAYLLDFDNAAGASSQSLGIRVTGDHALGGDGPKLDYAAELATQSDYKDNPTSYDASYYLLEAGLSWQRFGFRIGYEVLGSDDGVASFQTPLATAHKFNGWADQFLSTPANGLEDWYVEGSAKWLKGDWRLIYHDFSADTGGGDYGDELDFVASWKFQQNYSVLVKFALYSADQHSVDTDKAWVMLTADF